MSSGAGDSNGRLDPSRPRVSVVIVSYNGRRHLERCLPALARTTGVAFETILADNGSTDGTVAWATAAFPDTRIVALGRNLGFGAANARGVAAAHGDLVAFLNCDTEVEAGWLAELERVIAGDESIAAACSTLHLLDRPWLVNARGGGMTRLGYGFDRDFCFPVEPSPLAPEPELREVLFPTAAAMLIRRSDFLGIRGFDPAIFMYHEDVDLGWRLWLAGRRVVVCRDSIVRHAHGGSALAARGRRWKDRLGARHTVRSVLKNRALLELAPALLGLARLWVRNRAAGHAFAALWWNLAHLPGTLRERARVQRRRRVTDRWLAERGLISPRDVPPAPPQAPAAGTVAGRLDLVPTNVLRPGYHSALGRLGPGWYARELDDHGWLRETCGHSHCILQAEPGSTGRLTVTAAFRGTPPADGEVLVSCNGREARDELPPGQWRDIALPVAADGGGRLDVRISSRAHSEGVAAHRAGCAVREVRFAPAKPAPAPAYASMSVILPTYNRWAILRETLDALAAQTCRDFEVIVIDDGSTDGTWEKLEGWGRANAARLRLVPLHQENLKPGRARNLGLRHAGGDLVLFIGDDTVPGPELVAQHLAKHNEIGETVAVLGFTDWHRERMRVTPFLELINRDGQQFSYGHFNAGDDVLYTNFYTSNISLPRWLLGEDPFHPAFTFVDWEDVELGYRLSLRGVRIVYHPAAMARHVHPMTMARFYRRQVHVGRTAGVLLALHPELAGDEAMPPPAPPRWFPFVRWPVRALLPLLSLWDRLGLPLPRRVSRAVLLTAYFTGRALGYPAARHAPDAPGKEPAS